MKISKLFHWLYAVLMFLPLVMFLPSCLYYSLNKYATNETTTEINYKYQSNEVNTLDDLVEGNIYSFNCYALTYNDIFNDETQGFVIELLTPLEIQQTLSDGIAYTDLNRFGVNTILELVGDSYIYTYTSEYQYEYESCVNEYQYTSTFESNCIVRLIKNYFEYAYEYFTYTNYNVIESVDTNVQDTISNKMYLAWEGVWNLPLFQWTKDSFITTPFSYITGLFGLSSDNTLNCVFTYFASISICWLVFDLIMYVPNLAHRWLDKGAIE